MMVSPLCHHQWPDDSQWSSFIGFHLFGFYSAKMFAVCASRVVASEVENVLKQVPWIKCRHNRIEFERKSRDLLACQRVLPQKMEPLNQTSPLLYSSGPGPTSLLLPSYVPHLIAGEHINRIRRRSGSVIRIIPQPSNAFLKTYGNNNRPTTTTSDSFQKKKYLAEIPFFYLNELQFVVNHLLQSRYANDRVIENGRVARNNYSDEPGRCRRVFLSLPHDPYANEETNEAWAAPKGPSHAWNKTQQQQPAGIEQQTIRISRGR